MQGWVNKQICLLMEPNYALDTKNQGRKKTQIPLPSEPYIQQGKDELKRTEFTKNLYFVKWVRE